MGTSNHRLHPAQARVARRANLAGVVFLRRKLDVRVAALVQEQFSEARARTHEFPLVPDVHEIILHRDRPTAKFQVTRPLDANAVHESHAAIHLETEIRRVRRAGPLEMRDSLRPDVAWKLARGLHLPFGQDALGEERRKMALPLVRVFEVKRVFATRAAVPQDGRGLPRIVIAVVQEEHDFTAEFLLPSSCRDDLRIEKPSRENAAGLLTKADDGVRHGVSQAGVGDGSEGGARKTVICRMTPKRTTPAQPMRLYHR